MRRGAESISIRGERGNVPEKGLAAEIHRSVSAGFGLVFGRICHELSHFVESYRSFCMYAAV